MYQARRLEPTITNDLEVFPVVVLTGARQTGKSTLTRSAPTLAERPYLTLDDPSVREQAQRAPMDLLQRHPEMTLDEVQRVPELLLAIKALVDRDYRPGRFLLTGSANLALMKGVADSLAGRASYRVLHPMTRGEQGGLPELWTPLFARPFDQWAEYLQRTPSDGDDWVRAAKIGGFPVPAVQLRRDADRAAWLEGYVRTYVERDLRDLSAIQNLAEFRRLMRVAAHRLGGLVNQANLARDAGLASTTAQRYLDLLETSHLLIRLEPYSRNRTKRLIKAPKLYWADTALALHLSGEEPAGAHLENLVLVDLLAWSETVSATRPRLLHWRTASGQEVDFVIEDGDALYAIEVKASTHPLPSDAKHLRAFRDEYGDAVRGCLLLHGGNETYRLEDRIVVTPWWKLLW